MAERDKERETILAEKQEIDEKLAALEEERTQAREILERTQSEIETLNNHIESGKNTIIEALNNRATIKSRLGRFDTMLEQVNIRKAELNSRLLRAKSDEAEQTETIKKLEEEFEAITGSIKELTEQQELMEERLAGGRDELAGTDQNFSP